ncbi:hypothetical protein Pint_21979 [Pistacia integerrima]|uniref:Uncharacterized protein n=1 Tax=Pistacia integerrima TaxID=434235 RepID=A0ACC0YNC4_9ROSI|nr:hypothetical protein Pint_21979 [Pistacia integerrima]
MRGDILRAADLLQKAGNFKEASELILHYVFSNSLWSSGSKGWPLKQFEKRRSFWGKAKSLAENDSYQFSEFVQNEADILSNEQCNLFMLSHQLNASKRHQSIRGEILSVRTILDFHLHLSTSEYGWEDELVSDLVAYSEDTIHRNQVYGRQYSNLGTKYLLLNPDAEWIREVDKRMCSNEREVLENLDAIRKQSFENSSSVFCKVRNSTYIYEVSKSLLNSKFLHHQHYDTKALQNFVELSTKQFFDFIFPLDWRESLKGNLISLRGTETCRNIIKEVIFQNIGLRSQLSYGQIGKCGSYDSRVW